jgi:hypothetical protein
MRAIQAAMVLGALSLTGCYSEPSTVRVRVREPSPGLTTEDVVKMANAGISDSVIVDQIKSRGMETRPSADQIVSLKSEGVSDAVLEAMNNAQPPASRERIVEYVNGYPYYPYYPYPYPYYGPYYSVGFYWGYPYYYPYYHYPYYGHGPYYGSVHAYRH